MRIDKAYCEELGREVDIEQACEEFAAQDAVSRFHFLCSDPVCRAQGVRVSAINHTKVAQDSAKVSPHYRLWDQHHPDCEWMELEEALKEEEPGVRTRQTRVAEELQTVNTRLITSFVIPDVNNELVGVRAEEEELQRIRAIPDRRWRLNARRDYARQTGATTRNLDALVSCFLALREKHLLDGQQITIQGVGERDFRNLFRHIKQGIVDEFAVYHSGARFYKRYNNGGFSLYLIDKLDDESVSLYISGDAIQKYRPAKRFNRDIDELLKLREEGENPYFTIYWFGGLTKGERGYSVDFRHLSHFTMRLRRP